MSHKKKAKKKAKSRYITNDLNRDLSISCLLYVLIGYNTLTPE